MKIDPVRVIEKKRTRQDSQKVTKALYLTYLGEAPTEPICTKICRIVAVLNVITRAKFGTEILKNYDFTWVEFSDFLLILACALQQCSATAMPVISNKSN